MTILGSALTYCFLCSCRRAIRDDPSACILFVVPRRDWARDLASRLRARFGRAKAANVGLLLRPTDFQAAPTASGGQSASISVTFPGAIASGLAGSALAFDGWAQSFALVILDDLHLLDAQYEIVASRLLAVAKASLTRVVGLAMSLNDPQDVGTWLGAEASFVYSFLPKDRNTALATAIQTFTLPHSAILNKAMIKPAFDIVRAAAQPAILFASSRAHCLSAAADLVTQSGTHMDLNGFLAMNPEELEPTLSSRLRDKTLTNGLLRGIGVFHPGLAPSDTALVLELFATGVLRVLVVAREACWSLPVRAPVVVVLGTQYLQHGAGGASASKHQQQRDRQVSTYPLHEVLQMQSFAILPPSSLASSAVEGPATGSFTLFCQAEHRELYLRFLSAGLPLESTLPASGLLRPVLQSEQARGTVQSRQDAVDLLAHTLLPRRMRTNPTFYAVAPKAELDDDEGTTEGSWATGVAVEERLSRLIDQALDEDAVAEAEIVDSKVLEVAEAAAPRHVPGSAPKA
jgi:antiviral helicase SLH1